MAINFKSTFKTITVTKNQLNDMINAQEKGIYYVSQDESNAAVIVAGVVGFSATILALVFIKSTAVGVGTGIASLVTTAAASVKQSVRTRADDGKLQLLSTFRTMTNLGATSVNMDVAYIEVYDQATLANVITFVQGTAINYYTLPNGTKVTQ